VQAEDQFHQGGQSHQTAETAGNRSPVIDNIMIGGMVRGCGSVIEAKLSLPRHHGDEAALRRHAVAPLRVVGLEGLADVRADRLQHTASCASWRLPAR
jgi:branched-chain amino acid transport system ATP-binding protein/branched-chain amino acid transport system permease protein